MRLKVLFALTGLVVTACAVSTTQPLAPTPTLPPREYNVVAVAVSNIALQLEPRRTICLAIADARNQRSDPSEALMSAIRTDDVVSMSRCPRTYSNSLVSVDSLGRRIDPAPPGYVDPIHLAVPVSWLDAPDPSSLVLLWHIGDAGGDYRCRNQVVSGQPVMECQRWSTWIG